MKSIILVLLISLSLVAAKPERYIIMYDDIAWETQSLRYLPTNTKYILKELKMQVAELDLDEIQELQAMPGVTLEKDQPVSINQVRPNFVQNNPPNWGIDRIDQSGLPLDKLYHYDSVAAGVDIWIVDTGVYPDHVEFGGRATFEKNFAEDGQDEDCDGHGTHVSSTIAGINVGVAKGATVHGVKVLDCYGSGTLAGVLAGINYVIAEHKKVPNRKSVINMSLGGGKMDALNQAVAAASKAGIVVVVAAGNSSGDACSYSPSSAPDAIAVAASDKTDTSAYFTNYGKCVVLYAPGVDVYAAYIGSKDAYTTMSGTSMASPHTAGTVALILASGAATTPAEVKKALQDNGIKDAIKNVPAQTANILLNSWKESSRLDNMFA